MNETPNPYSTPNVARPNGDQRLRTPEGQDPPGTGNAPGARIVATPATGSAASPPTAANPSAGTAAPMAAPVTAPATAPATAATAPASAPVAAPATAPALLEKVVQGAHHTVDRLAETAAPAVRKLGERVSATENALHAGTDHLRQVRDEWTTGVRTTVRDNPLVSVVGALFLGALIARITR